MREEFKCHGNLQGLSQDLILGAQNWHLSNFWASYFSGKTTQNTQITTINMHFILGIRHNILIQCHGNGIEKLQLP